MSQDRIVAYFAAMLGVVAILAAGCGCGDSGGSKPTHKATCWKPTYAANPDADWAKNPSPQHRHGAGPKGVNVCG